MAITFVGSASYENPGSATQFFPPNLTFDLLPGDLIFIGIWTLNQSQTISGIGFPQSTYYQQLWNQNATSAAGGQSWGYIAVNNAYQPANTSGWMGLGFSASQTTITMEIAVFRSDDQFNRGAFDVAASVTTGTAASATKSITTTNANDLILGFCTTGSGGVTSVSAGTGLITPTNKKAIIYTIATSAGSVTHTAAINATNRFWTLGMVAVKKTSNDNIVQRTNYNLAATGAASIPVTFAGAQTAGNINVAILRTQNGTAATVNSVSDSNNGAYTLAATKSVGSGTGGCVISLFYRLNIASCAAKTNVVTASQNDTGAYPAFDAWEIKGGYTRLEATATNSGGSGTSGTQSLTTTAGSDIIIAAFTNGTTGVGGMAGPAAGWSASVLDSYGAGNAVDYQQASSPGTFTDAQPNYVSMTQNWASIMAAFTTVGPATYYVSPTGSDSAAGTSTGTAWQTIGKVNAHAFQAGDIILFQGGQTFSGNLYLGSVNGTASQPIGLGSYGTGNATISTPAGNVSCYLYDSSYIQISNLNFTGPGAATANQAGIFFYNDLAATRLAGCSISGCNITGFTQGIMFGSSAATNGYSSPSITNCNSYANSTNGIYIYGGGQYSHTGVTISGCNTYNNLGIAAQSSNTGSGIILGEINGGTVSNCVSYGNGANNTYAAGPVGIWCFDSTGVTIQNCESYNNSSNKASGGGDGGGFDIDGGCTSCIIQYCYSHGNVGPGFQMYQYSGAASFSGNKIRYNISENDGAAGLFTGAAGGGYTITNSDFYNNTVYNNAASPIYVNDANLSGITFKNNILVSGSSGVDIVNNGATVSSGVTFANNDYYGTGTWHIHWNGTTYTTLASWGLDATGLSSNPLLINAGGGGTIGVGGDLTTLRAYKLQAGSPAVNAGATITSPGSVDFYGQTLFTGAPDIGAEEVPPSQTVSPSGIASTLAFGSATLSSLATISPGGIASTNAFGNATLAVLNVISPPAITSTVGFGSHSISGGSFPQTVSPSGIASTLAFGNQTVIAAGPAQTVSPSGIGSTLAFGLETVGSLAQVLPTGIGSTAAFGNATVTPGTATISPPGIASTLAFGNHAIAVSGTLIPFGIASTEREGIPTVTVGPVTISPPGIASTLAFGNATFGLTIAPSGIASTAAFGNATMGVVISPPGIASTEAEGLPTLQITSAPISPLGIASTLAFGLPVVLQNVISPSGIASTEREGIPTIIPGGVLCSPSGIASTVAFGNPVIYQSDLLEGANPVPPYTGQNQTEIAIPPYPWEDGPSVVPPYAITANYQSQQESLPPPISKTELWSAMQTWPL